MEDTEEFRMDMMQRLKPFAGAPSPSSSVGGRGLYGQLSPNLMPDIAKRPGIPPVHPFFPTASPYSRIPSASGGAAEQPPASLSLSHPPSDGVGFNLLPSHSRSTSQPPFFSLESLSSFSSFPFPDPAAAAVASTAAADVNMAKLSAALPLPPSPGKAVTDGLQQRKAHRRSQSDIPFGFIDSALPMAGLPPLPHQLQGLLDRPAPVAREGRQSSSKPPVLFVKQEAESDREGDCRTKSDGDAGDDLISAYMNLDGLEALNNSSGTEEKREDLDSRASGSKTNGAESSENEAESSMNESECRMAERKERNKRNAVGDPVPFNSTSRHCRSISMDSFMGKLNFGDEMSKQLPSPGSRPGQHSRSGQMDGSTCAFSLEFGNGEFSDLELKKIMANKMLAELAMTDPKRVKRILANRQSAARSKERKMRYITELEHKVQTLQTEATTLSAQLTLLQRDSAGLTSQNNHLKFRLQAMEQQAQLRDGMFSRLS
ncbi:Transcription factor VIP1 [Apostasia shenzhenica]|uniref:Transcription factor VIP1 n=1 Tax=Apostasia shenzhenica TaxID=1088818 RepID=A0A2H9ZWP0_9ASPA|nr:Transcription factor VIP1 [Apostasia shenzhenica]